VAKVDPQHVMALRRLTDLPVSACRDALAEAGGDIGAVVQRLRGSPCCGLHGSDAEVAALLASHGVNWVPPARPTRVVPDDEVVAELVFNGQAVSDYFLVGGLVCHINRRGEMMARATDDPDLAAATTAYLLRIGAREFESFAGFQAWRSDAEPGAATG
jgi:hypothetical protein